MMKDELGGRIMMGFAGLRSKSYAYEELDGTESKRCKGVKTCIVKSQLTFTDFKNCLMSGKEVFRKQKVFRSKGHNIDTVETNELVLSREDHKWIIKSDLISTLARGSHDLVWSPILGEVALE